MRAITSIFVALLPAAAVAFVPAPHHNSMTTTLRAATSSKPDMTGDIDISHAHYCADHFGECSLEEMERARDGKSNSMHNMFYNSTKDWIISYAHSRFSYYVYAKTALHQERVSHLFTNTDGLQNPHGIAEDIDHKVLENSLSFQIGLLQDKLATEHMQEDTAAAYGMNPYSSTMNMPLLDGGLDEESSETLMICLAIAALAFLPQLLGN